MTIESASAAGAAASSSSASAQAIWIGAGGAAGAVTLAAIVVMLIKRPRTVGEWAVALISTVMSSLALGSWVVLWLGMHKGLHSRDAVEAWGSLMVLGGVLFACGLPGWVLVRIAFNTMFKFQDSTAQDVRQAVRDML